jgi:hypothetical protein
MSLSHALCSRPVQPSACSFDWWLRAGAGLFFERKVLLAGCWWLVWSERKVLLAGGDKPSEQSGVFGEIGVSYFES